MQLFSRKQKKEEKDLLAGDPHDPDYIVYCLNYAMDLRSCLHLDFFIGHRQTSQLRSVCVAVDRQRFIVNLLDDVPDLPSSGMAAQVYFTIHGGRKSVPCSFKTKVLRERRDESGQYLFFALPEYMEHNQRRANVRVDVGKENIPDFAVWHGNLSSGGDALASPSLRWTRMEDASVRLADISAGGMRLEVSDSCREYYNLHPKDVLLIKGDFSAQGKKSSSLSVVGTIVRVNESEKQKIKTLAVRFLRWLQLREDKGVWLKVDEQGGVPAIGVWIFQYLLERNRLLKEESR